MVRPCALPMGTVKTLAAVASTKIKLQHVRMVCELAFALKPVPLTVHSVRCAGPFSRRKAAQR